MKIALLSFSILLCSSLFGQVELFITYEDYVAGNSIKYEGLAEFKHGEGSVSFIKNGKTEKYRTGKIWGFTLRGELWKSAYFTLLKLMTPTDAPLLYYEFAGMYAAKELGKEYYEDYLIQTFFSVDLNGEIIKLYNKGGLKKKMLKFGKTHPEVQSAIDCVLENSRYMVDVRKCVNKYYESLNNK